jgi:hypothetical protein
VFYTFWWSQRDSGRDRTAVMRPPASPR